MDLASRKLTLSEETFRQVIGLSGMSGRWGFPVIPYDQSQYVKAREELSQKAYAYEDFDGKIHPNGALACMMDVFNHAVAGFSLRTKNAELFIIRGPVDSVYAKKEGLSWSMERILLEETYLRIEAVKKEKKEEIEELLSQRVEKIKESDDSMAYRSVEIRDLSDEIDRHQDMFWHHIEENG